MIENDAYLIHALDESVTITIKDSRDVLIYDNPFRKFFIFGDK